MAPGEVERLERGEASQRGQVAAELLAPGEVERLERGEARQRGQVAAELFAPERLSDWSEVRPASGDRSPLSCSTRRGRAIGAR